MITKKEYRLVVLVLLSIITLTTIFKSDCNCSKGGYVSHEELKELEQIQ